MEYSKKKAIMEAILFAAGREVDVSEFASALEIKEEEVIDIIQQMKSEYAKEDRGIELINVNGAYQLCTKKDLYEYIYPIFDNRSKPNLSQAALETLSIIAYNPKVTRAEVEAIRGVNSDGTFYKLLDYNLIKEVGKLDAPGRPMTYSVTSEFYRMFGIGSVDELPELPKYKLDENEQIVIDELIEDKKAEDNVNSKENQEEKEEDK